MRPSWTAGVPNSMMRSSDGRSDRIPAGRLFVDSVRRYRIPHRYFHDMIDGVTSDLQPREIETFEELYQYCYQVASVVGLTITTCLGFEDPQALVLAEKCGIAFQLTNIISDVREDEELGRCYLPREDRDRYPDLRDLLAFEAGAQSSTTPIRRLWSGMVHRESRASLWALIEIYRRLLEKIEASGFNVMHERIRLTGAEKISIVLRAMILGPKPASTSFAVSKVTG